MVNYSSARYYQKKQIKAKKQTREAFQNLSEEEEEKIHNMVVNDTKAFLKMKRKCWLSIEKLF